MPPVAKPQNPGTDKKPRRKKRKPKRIPQPTKLCLKTCWLKTSEDWTKFNAWAQVKALPKKVFEPELLPPRPKKPLRHFKKRLKLLANPKVHPADLQCVTREVSRAALLAKTTKHTKRLARPKFRDDSSECHEWTVRRAALMYQASETILKLSEPKKRPEPEDCREAGVSRNALKRKTTETDEKLARPKRVKGEDTEVKRGKKKEETELSPWIEFLALPPYKTLKDQHTEKAEKMKEQIIEGLDTRGKQALEEQMKTRREGKNKQEKERNKQEEETKKQEEERKAQGLDTQPSKTTTVVEGEENADEVEIEEKAETPKEKKQQDKEDEEEKKKHEGGGEEKKEDEEDEDSKKKRKMEKDAWRFVDSTCKEYPPKIPKSALNYNASEKIQKLAKPKERKDDCVVDPFKVSDAAMCATASPVIEGLAKPKHLSEPVQRSPPREKDEYGRPIFPKPPYGKVLPKVKPYEVKGECPEKKKAKEEEAYEGDDEMEETDENGEESGTESVETKTEESKEKRPIDPIAFEPTIDPLFDSVLAARQAKERKRAAEEAEKERERKEKIEGEKEDGEEEKKVEKKEDKEEEKKKTEKKDDREEG